MSEHMTTIPQAQALNNAHLVSSSPPKQGFAIPHPHTTKRTRTISASERALDSPTLTGKVKEFCRDKGHGFIIPDDKESEDVIFVHISDIEGEYVPKAGDLVSYKRFLTPPKNEKYQAVHVQITKLVDGTSHETWDNSAPPVY